MPRLLPLGGCDLDAASSRMDCAAEDDPSYEDPVLLCLALLCFDAADQCYPQALYVFEPCAAC